MSLIGALGLFEDPLEELSRNVGRMADRLDVLFGVDDDGSDDGDCGPDFGRLDRARSQKRRRLSTSSRRPSIKFAPSIDKGAVDADADADKSKSAAAVAPARKLTASTRTWRPKVDVSESDTQYTVRAELPGVAKSDVGVEVRGDGAGREVLVLSGHKRSESEQSGHAWRRVERSFGDFRRSFVLPRGVQPEQVAAQFDNGVLVLTVPKPPAQKAEEPAVHRIAID
eukprot:m51a1_g6914 putative heat shock protein hsp20 (226) ;mRNA; r:129579-130256